MPEGSTRVLIALSAVILVLSFKDLIVSNNSVDQAQESTTKNLPPTIDKKTLDDQEDFNADDILKTHNFDEDEDDASKEDNIPVKKEIPKLKINNNNNLQQLKFLFW